MMRVQELMHMLQRLHMHHVHGMPSPCLTCVQGDCVQWMRVHHAYK